MLTRTEVLSTSYHGHGYHGVVHNHMIIHNHMIMHNRMIMHVEQAKGKSKDRPSSFAVWSCERQKCVFVCFTIRFHTWIKYEVISVFSISIGKY